MPEEIQLTPEYLQEVAVKVVTQAFEDAKTASVQKNEETEVHTLWERLKSFFEADGEKRTYSTEQRREMANKGQARPDGSYPIADKQDLHNAIMSFGRGGANPADKAHIKKRARALGATDMLPEGWKEFLPEANSFKVYEDTEGNKRWISLSTNAFEDREGEIFTTKALEEGIEYADKEDARGPLLVYHVPSAEIGQCDFQALVGRFVLESGTFLDTPLGQKAVEYFENTDEDFQVSIGYRYIKGDEEDGVYDWMRFKERSITPYGAAANPWTDFQMIVKEKAMDERKSSFMEKIFGPDFTKDIISSAEAKTKELEESVRFKELEDEQEEDFGEIEDIVEVTPEIVSTKENHSHGVFSHTHIVTVGKVHSHDKGSAFKAMKKPMDKEDMMDQGADESSEDANGKKKPAAGKKEGEEVTEPTTSDVIGLLRELVVKVETLSPAVSALQNEVKELKASDDQKVASLISTQRLQIPNSLRPSESEGNIISEEKAKELGLNGEKTDDNPARKYVESLFAGNGAAAN